LILREQTPQERRPHEVAETEARAKRQGKETVEQQSRPAGSKAQRPATPHNHSEDLRKLNGARERFPRFVK
jgi:hypothetical protein